ncbi:helix-turn-helix domain-containing protein [Fluviicola taffensis]|uniref:Helix-turn-helix domain-containing protein AraC type n=1 Tax=Fluviicola taffensis (strain DSM 16823 / NCIMB 13979 / RW262) TaxID=755732 RepID=F2IFD1_FLUTR|nr:helix-turn-helix domain-containing protein [Fluviicola taffensis]AEA44616.1 helix-turn-helix domain-containing protein AraC type [Fluviicola taffensis DSM 16823]
MQTNNENKSLVNAVPLPHPNELLIIESLDYSNPYDYHALHRHDYFEIILITNGEGNQLIDFVNYPVYGEQISMIYPGQVHLMNRNTANGLLIQFRKDIFEYIYALKHFNLYLSNPIFTLDTSTFNHLFDLTECMRALLQNENLSPLSKHKAYNYLQIILISLVESQEKYISRQYLVTEFLFLMSENIYTIRKVSEYCALLNCTAEKLNEVCKKALGKNALQLIHEEVLLEIKRLLLLNQLSLKEIAFQMNFDSQANFSGFIKSRTQLSPSELHAEVLEIYK